MAAWTYLLGLFSLLVVGVPWRVTALQQLPVLLWSSESALWSDQPGTHEGHVTTDRQLDQCLDSALSKGPRTVLVFHQDKLSIEDFTAFGGVYGNKQDSAFPNLESIMGSSPSSLVLPSVDWFAVNTILIYLKDKLGVSPLYVEQSTLLQLRMNESVPSLLVFSLPYPSNSGLMGVKDGLRANDEVIGQVLSTLKSEGISYTAILTARQPSRMTAEADFGTGSLGRHLLAAATPSYAPVAYNGTGNNPCILFWASNISLHTDQTELDLTNRTFITPGSGLTVGSTCSETDAVLVLNYESGLKITFHLNNRRYNVSGRYWSSLSRIEVVNGTQSALFLSPQVSTPTKYSFHCQYISSFPRYSSMLINNSTKDSSGLKWNLHITDFQVQAFNVTGLRFSYASDCASFFSPGIWMGLVTTLLFVFILTYGLHMVMSLKTMDRFDDPKGPTISVPQTD
ncbi:V-type proton ATPase subunit S1 [Hyperolius riggenbachi]|uniref:V-type proton ATPase subunit S1 n=1 Tax=Hyperolius riggenbachi TaxID=752182 RepID=UPI0035A3B6F3